MTQTKVVIVEDQTVFREMLVELLRLEPGCSVVGAYGSAAEALAAQRTESCPEVAIVDLMLPDMTGLELVRKLRARCPKLRVLIVTAQQRADVVLDVFHAGVDGIVTKSAPLRELKDALHRVSCGAVYYCSTTSTLLRKHSRQRPAEPLTEREQQIVRLIALGRSSKEIATELDISPKTVANHRLRISRKLRLGDIAGLTRYAVSRGWVADDA